MEKGRKKGKKYLVCHKWVKPFSVSHHPNHAYFLVGKNVNFLFNPQNGTNTHWHNSRSLLNYHV